MVNHSGHGHIEIKNVSKKFVNLLGEEMPTVKDVTLDIAPGEFVCLMGPSGCGKTTLLRMIAGLITADEGQLFLDGELLEKPGYERGLVFQNPELFKWMTVEENVAFGLKARKVYKQEKENVQKYISYIDESNDHYYAAVAAIGGEVVSVILGMGGALIALSVLAPEALVVTLVGLGFTGTLTSATVGIAEIMAAKSDFDKAKDLYETIKVYGTQV